MIGRFSVYEKFGKILIIVIVIVIGKILMILIVIVIGKILGCVNVPKVLGCIVPQVFPIPLTKNSSPSKKKSKNFYV